MRISYWSLDVGSSDLFDLLRFELDVAALLEFVSFHDVFVFHGPVVRHGVLVAHALAGRPMNLVKRQLVRTLRRRVNTHGQRYQRYPAVTAPIRTRGHMGISCGSATTAQMATP